tara:strand:+ start:1955 stop:2311 length:357 start_codon:yes stop_codon:yes gene_type:complete
METYIVAIYAKENHASDVQEYYQDLQSMYEKATGFISRKIYRAKTGAMEQAVRATYSAEELANSPEEDHDHGEHFVMIEEWDSLQDRINFGRSLSKEHHLKVIPFLLPNHSHEFYELL